MTNTQNTPGPKYYCLDAGLNQSECSICGAKIQGPSKYDALPYDHAEKQHSLHFHDFSDEGDAGEESERRLGA